MASAEKRQSRAVAVGVCLVCLAVAGILGVKVYRYYHYRLCPFSAGEVSSLSMYDSRQIEKKEITRQGDITELIDAMNQRGERYLTSLGLRPSQHGIYLSFRMKDGSQAWYFCEIYPAATYINDRRVQIRLDGSIDLWDYWDRMDYEIQKDAGSELAQIMTAFREELEQEK